jgi:hypothetical protein
MTYDEDAVDIAAKTRAKIAEGEAKLAKVKNKAKAKIEKLQETSKSKNEGVIKGKIKLAEEKIQGKIVKGYFTGKIAQAELKARDVMGKIKNKFKKGFRKTKDKTCEMTDGKAKCGVQKIKHKVQNTLDDLPD